MESNFRFEYVRNVPKKLFPVEYLKTQLQKKTIPKNSITLTLPL